MRCFTHRGGQVPEMYQRSGAVVELYVYTTTGDRKPSGNTCASLGEERPFPMTGSGPWMVTAPVTISMSEPPARCEVAIQPARESVPVVSAPQLRGAREERHSVGVVRLSIGVLILRSTSRKVSATADTTS
jgi:hypothetical protein